VKPAYSTAHGAAYCGDSSELLHSGIGRRIRGKASLILTSPPYPLNRQKAYGNKQGQSYLDWLATFGPIFHELLAEDGSLVVELGNTWNRGQPTMSTLPLRALMRLQESADFYLCQQFIWHNPARLPSPAQWVTVERIRLKDSHTHVWWMSPSPTPKANNRNVLTEYSAAMKSLLKSGRYNSGARPSEHVISDRGFVSNNQGAIPGSVLSYANTGANSGYHKYCKSIGVKPHPARMPPSLAEFFINFLTEPGDLVVDPFAGSNTTGATAEQLGRRWVSIEKREDYVAGSKGRFAQLIEGERTPTSV